MRKYTHSISITLKYSRIHNIYHLIQNGHYLLSCIVLKETVMKNDL